MTEPESEIITNPGRHKRSLIVGVPMTGMVRSEWAIARYGQAIPCNWSSEDVNVWISQISPIGYGVADARNMICKRVVDQNVEWLLFIDHDVVLPRGALLTISNYMRKGDTPIVNGLYFTRSMPAEPLVYRGIGTSYYGNWKIGDLVWASGAGLGCTLISGDIIRSVWDESEEYMVGEHKLRRVFRNPGIIEIDPETGIWSSTTGTEDLDFYKRVHEGGHYEKAGFPKIQTKKYPILIDTGLFCRHIDWDGRQYPIAGEELEFTNANNQKVHRDK